MQRVRRHVRRHPAHRSRPETKAQARKREQAEGLTREERERRALIILRGEPNMPISLSPHDRDNIRRLQQQVRDGQRAGYTYTSHFQYDIDNQAQMEHTYDALGHRVMFVIASTNRPAKHFDPSESVVGPSRGVSLWRDANGVVYMDDIQLYFDIDDETALRIAREKDQFMIHKVDGRTRSHAFLEAPGYDVEIRGEGTDRTFSPKTEVHPLDPEYDPWRPYTSRSGNIGWKNRSTGEIVYRETKPTVRVLTPEERRDYEIRKRQQTDRFLAGAGKDERADEDEE